MGETVVLVNLHTHSTMSDGDLPPEELAALLSANGVAYAALTDHDSVSGSAAFRASLARRGIGCVDGVELTAETSAGQAHILAYGIDPENPDLLALLPRQGGAEARSERRQGPRQSGAPPIAEAIRVVHASGGAAFLAHPLHFMEDETRLEALIEEFAGHGLDGIEAIYAGYGPERQKLLLELADRRGLAVCAGGDFHEAGRREQSAAMEMPEDRWIAFRDLLLRRSGGSSQDADPEPVTGSARKPLPARLAARIVLPALITFAVFISFLFLVFIPRDETLIMDRKKETIRELTEVAVSILVEYDAKAAAGTMSAEQARAEAAARLRDLRYGQENKDYFWITDMYPRMVMHPYRPDLEGRDLTEFKDGAGKAVFVEFVDAVRLKADGYVEYLWQWEDVADRIVPKVSYVRRFKPWDWVIGTGIYLEDVKAEIRALTLNLVLLGVLVSLVMSFILATMVRRGFRVERGKLDAEASLRESHERYRALADGSTDGTVIVLGGACVFANGALCGMTGYSQREIQLLRVGDLLEGFSSERAAGMAPASFLSRAGASLSSRSKLAMRSGKQLDVFVSESPITLGDRQGLVLSVKEALPAPEGVIEPALRLREIPDPALVDFLWLSGPASALARGFPVCRLDESVRDAAALMRGGEDSGAIVADNAGKAIGILGPEDIAFRSVALSADPSAPVSSIMTAPIPTASSGATVAEAVAAMNGAGAVRVALRKPDGALDGVLSAQAIGLAFAGMLGSLKREAGAADSPVALANIVSGAPPRLRSLSAAGARPRAVLRLYADLQDALAESLARMAIRELGPAPCPWAFISFGSMGRQEFLPGSDQDNALVWDDSGAGGEAERRYFLALADRVCAGLEKLGIPPCPGGVMASNPAWNGPIREWERRFEASISEPEPGRLLDMKIVLDLRASAGFSSLADGLRRSVCALVAGQPSFLMHLALDEKQRKLPSGVTRSAQPAGLKDLGGAFAGFARLYALRKGICAVNSFDRFEALANCGVLKPDAEEGMADALEAVLEMRLSRSLRSRPGVFSAREESLYAFALGEAVMLQKRIGFDFMGSGL